MKLSLTLSFSLRQRSDNTDLTFEDIHMLLEQLKHRSVCLSQKVNARLEGLFCSTIDRKMAIPFDIHEPPSSNSNDGRLLGIYLTAHLEPLRKKMDFDYDMDNPLIGNE